MTQEGINEVIIVIKDKPYHNELEKQLIYERHFEKKAPWPYATRLSVKNNNQMKSKDT